MRFRQTPVFQARREEPCCVKIILRTRLGAWEQMKVMRVAVHQCSYAYCTLHRAHGDFTWLFAGLMGAAAWRPVRRASTTISGSLLEQIIVPGCAASQRTGKVWRYQRGFSMQHRTPDVPAVKRLVPRLRGDVRRPFRVTVFDRRQLADGTIGVSLPHLPGRTRSALQSTE